MDVLGLIPARGGSKGIPRKNLITVGGKPLLAWTVAAARQSETVTRTVVSTEDEKVGAVARELGAIVLARPRELAEDETPMQAVVEHALGELGRPDVLVLLQPTSPLRRAEHVDEAVALLRETGADCVVSVVEVPHRYGPESLMALDGGRLVALGGSASRRQDKRRMLARNGPAVLALRGERLGGDLYAGDCRPYLMRPEDSIDVDEPFDLELAEFLLARR
ncbi:MAG: CMP-N,N-diacetyllegionaminic acid synthase [Gaiellaceae bacterium]|nr:CMP-N,N-diacetyllegionaminic acid synthase [Gaiellaceae bacterium]